MWDSWRAPVPLLVCVDQAGDEPPHPPEPLFCSSGASWHKTRICSRIIPPCPFVSPLVGGSQGRWTAEEGDLAVFDQETWLCLSFSLQGVSHGRIFVTTLESDHLNLSHPGHERVCQALGHVAGGYLWQRTLLDLLSSFPAEEGVGEQGWP